MLGYFDTRIVPVFLVQNVRNHPSPLAVMIFVQCIQLLCFFLVIGFAVCGQIKKKTRVYKKLFSLKIMVQIYFNIFILAFLLFMMTKECLVLCRSNENFFVCLVGKTTFIKFWKHLRNRSGLK